MYYQRREKILRNRNLLFIAHVWSVVYLILVSALKKSVSSMVEIEPSFRLIRFDKIQSALVFVSKCTCKCNTLYANNMLAECH